MSKSYLERKPLKDTKVEPFNVLSIASGMGGERQTFHKAGLPVKKIYTAEIDPFANQVVQNNDYRYPGVEIIPIGDIKSIPNDFLHNKNVRVVVGGPPCQEFSLINPHGKGLKSEKGSIASKFMDLIQKAQDYPELKDQILFFMEETKMKPKDAKEISERLGEIFGLEGPLTQTTFDARHAAPMSRMRYAWAYGFPNKIKGVAEKGFNDYINYNVNIGNTMHDPIDIFNTDLKKDDTLESLVKDGKVDLEYSEKKHKNNQDKWHPVTQWAPTIIASEGTYTNPRANARSFATAYKNPIVRAIDSVHDAEFPIMWDPDNKYTGKAKPVINERTGKIKYTASGGIPYELNDNGKTIFINTDKRQKSPFDMIPGQLYEHRIPSIPEAEVLFGWPVGYTDITPEQKASINDRIDAMRAIRNQLTRKHGLYVNELPKTNNKLDYEAAVVRREKDRELLQALMVNMGVPVDLQDLNLWYNYAGDIALKYPELHMLGNGWQTDATELLFRILFNLGGERIDDSDRRTKNIISAVKHRF
jgi:hypothetical protein